MRKLLIVLVLVVLVVPVVVGATGNVTSNESVVFNSSTVTPAPSNVTANQSVNQSQLVSNVTVNGTQQNVTANFTVNSSGSNSSNVSVLANMTVNATLKLANATKHVVNRTVSKARELLRLKKRETIEWELFDKTAFSEFYVPKRNQSFFVSIISKHENSKIAIAYSENTRFLYENVYLTIINRNQSNLTLRFVTDQDAKTFETNKAFLMMKIRFSSEVHRLSFYVEEGNRTLFKFENVTILHRTYESYIREETANRITIERSSYYGRLFGYMLTGIGLAFGANFLWYRRLKKRKEEEILGGFLP